MTDTKLLREKIKLSGLKMTYIADKLEITTAGLWNKVTNATEFKAQEIKTLCELLNIHSLKEREKIFFAAEVEKVTT